MKLDVEMIGQEKPKKGKPFGETKFGKWVTDKFLPFAGDAALGVIEALPTGNPVAISGAVLKALLKKRGDVQENSEEAKVLSELQVEYYRMLANHELEMARLEMEGYKIDAADRSDARQREVSIQEKGSWLAKNLTSVLAIFIVVLVFAAFYLILFVDLDATHDTIISMFGGGLITALTSVINFYFGSSSGSADKSRIIEKQLRGAGI